MVAYSIPNIPANYSVTKELVEMAVPMWVARLDGVRVLGKFISREWAEHTCIFHSSQQDCFEEA